jgi:hypothetical protein
VSTKAHRAERDGDGSPAATEPRAAKLGVMADNGAELARQAAVLTDGEEDAFSDVPTVSNRANPTVSPNEIDKEAGQGLAGAGSYRMLRPATSDHLENPAPATPERPAKRVIIGIARKS